MKFDLGTHVENPGPDSSPRRNDALTWIRPHPLTPFVEAWKGMVVVIVLGFQPVLELFSELSSEVRERFFINPVTAFGLLILLAALVGIAIAWLGWFVTRYALDGEAVQLRTGVLWRNRRQARLDRLQAVDVVQPFLARLVGLAEIRIEVAGGEGSVVRIGYLKEGEAQRLRNQILALSAGLNLDDEAQVPEAPENQIFEVPFGRLIASLVLSAAFMVPIALIGVLSAGAIIARTPEPFLANVPLLLIVGIQLWQRLNRGAFFRAATSPDGVRITHGLLEQRRQTVPPGRIQTVEISQTLLWRARGWWRVEMNVAGYGQANATTTQINDLLPVGDVDAALRALWLVVPDLQIEESDAVLNQALTGRDGDGGFQTSPRRARVIDPLVYRRTGFLVTPTALLIRRGRLKRRLTVVPHARIQSISAAQGPLQRGLRIAKFRIDTTVGPVTPEIPHLDQLVVRDLIAEENERARRARAADRSERWMAAGSGT